MMLERGTEREIKTERFGRDFFLTERKFKNSRELCLAPEGEDRTSLYWNTRACEYM